MDEIKIQLSDFVNEDDKRDMYDECYGAIKFMMDNGISLRDAVYTVKNLVREVRNNYGD